MLLAVPLWSIAGVIATMLLAIGCGSPIPGTADEIASTSPGVPLPWQHEFDPPAAPGSVRGWVQSIIDGDTISVKVQSQTFTVRLLGIDTPEKPGGPRPAECFGTEASAFIAELAPVGSAVTVTRDVETRDQYGRLLAWLHRDDGVFINLAMVESGHASALFFAPNDELEPLFERAAWASRRENRGLWAACGAPDIALNTEGS